MRWQRFNGMERGMCVEVELYPPAGDAVERCISSEQSHVGHMCGTVGRDIPVAACGWVDPRRHPSQLNWRKQLCRSGWTLPPAAYSVVYFHFPAITSDPIQKPRQQMLFELLDGRRTSAEDFQACCVFPRPCAHSCSLVQKTGLVCSFRGAADR